jgi:Rrf2 family protein
MSRIIHLSEAVSLGLHSMVIIAKAGKLTNANVIAEVTGASKNHLAKVLQRLVKANFLKSLRGPSGGFLLKKAPKEISILDIFEAIEGPIDTEGCPLDRPVCPFDNCMMDDMVINVSEDFKKFFKKKTLRDYL